MTGASVFDDLPADLPELERAVALQDRAAGVGFDWPTLGDVLAKIHEELAELEAGVAAGDQDNIAEEIGDLLFAVTNLARKQSISPAVALHAAGDKFIARFRHMERQARREGSHLADELLSRQLVRYQLARRQTRA